MTQYASQTIPDIQSQGDTSGINIDQVGVNDLSYPIVILDPNDGRREVRALISMSVDLPHKFKGTHMSRFLEVLNDHRGEITMRTLPVILADLRNRLDAETAHIEVDFQYFESKSAPVSGLTAPMDYRCRFVGVAGANTSEFVLEVFVPVTSLCPCSKAISDYGAHNQRGLIELRVRPKWENGSPVLIWIEELVKYAEQSASAPVYPILKREDERHVTMQAYDNPVFVEDVVRRAASQLKEDDRVDWFEVRATNQESIHNHNAFARIEWFRSTSAEEMGCMGTTE